jgi:ParB family chromosome partitioning protein
MDDQHQEYKVNNSIFLVELDKIKPNPLQPRAEFDEQKLKELSESIRQYGILQPLVVVRQEREVPTGTLVEYELVAGERRLRASKLAGLTQVPVIIRRESSDRIKLELALLENVQREDLNPIERAIAFKQLSETFGLKQREIGEKMGKSREFVANSLRILSLPEEMQKALVEGGISEGHTRPLLMLADRPEAQTILFKDIIYKKLSVRDAEKISRRIAHDRARKHDDLPDASTRNIEENLARTLGTRVTIERKGLGGVITISFFSDEELRDLLDKVAHPEDAAASAAMKLEAEEHFAANVQPTTDDQQLTTSVAREMYQSFVPTELKTPEIAAAPEEEMLPPADVHEIAPMAAIPQSFDNNEPPVAHTASVATLDEIMQNLDDAFGNKSADADNADREIEKEAIDKFVI